MVRRSGEENNHGSPLQPVIVGTKTLHGKYERDILQANARQATLFAMTIICRKMETLSAILSQRLDFDHYWESLHPYLLLRQQWPGVGWQQEENFALGAGELPREAACPALAQSWWESLQALSADPLPP